MYQRNGQKFEYLAYVIRVLISGVQILGIPANVVSRFGQRKWRQYDSVTCLRTNDIKDWFIENGDYARRS